MSCNGSLELIPLVKSFGHEKVYKIANESNKGLRGAIMNHYPFSVLDECRLNIRMFPTFI